MRRMTKAGLVGATVMALAAGGIGIALSAEDEHTELSPDQTMKESTAAGSSAEQAAGWPASVTLGGALLKVVPSSERPGYVCMVAELPEGNETSCAPDAVLQRDGVTRGFANYVTGISHLRGVAPKGTHIQRVDGMLVDGRFFYMPSGADSVKTVTYIDDTSGKVAKTVDLTW